MRYALAVVLLSVVTLLIAGAFFTYVREVFAKNARQVKRIAEDLPDWGSPPNKN
jgi:uncharacterized membrane protein YciS (DUF1049 family)